MALGAPGLGVGEVSQGKMGSVKCLLKHVQWIASDIPSGSSQREGVRGKKSHVAGHSAEALPVEQECRGDLSGRHGDLRRASEGASSLSLTDLRTSLVGHLSNCRSWEKAQPRDVSVPGQRPSP